MRKLDVLPYQPEWRELFAREYKLLTQVLPERVELHHIGSTAVPHMPEKPIVDMIMEVNDIKAVDEWNELLSGCGYAAKGENGISGRRFLIKGTEELRTHHLHVFAKENPEIERHIAFRDYMRAHPYEAKAYGRLKEKLAKRFPYDIEKYIEGKAALITEMDQKAAVWAAVKRMGM